MPGVNRHLPACGGAAMPRAGRARWLVLLCVLSSAPGWCQDNPYVYVRMSLLVPWTLYFLFLAAVLIPFVVMVVLAWRGQAAGDGRAQDEPDDASPPR